MAQYYGAPPNQGYAPSDPNNLQFYNAGHSTPAQAYGGYGGPSPSTYGVTPGFGGGFGAGVPGAVSGRMGEQGGLRTGWLAAFSAEGYDGEPPLLEELGVNFTHIQTKTLAVLNPFGRIDTHIMDDADLAGPVLFFFLYGLALLFSGSLHFGYVYGLGVLGSIALHTILSLMSPSLEQSDPTSSAASATPAYPGGAVPAYSASSSSAHAGAVGAHAQGGTSGLTFARSASVLGYCLLPLVLTSLVGILTPMDTPLGIVLTTAAILWCTTSASGIFCVTMRARAMRGLVAYPLALFYVGFGIMGVFSSRGSGTFGKVTPLAGGART